MHELLGLTLIELTEALRARKGVTGRPHAGGTGADRATHADLNAVVALRDRDALRRDARAAESASCAGRRGRSRVCRSA